MHRFLKVNRRLCGRVFMGLVAYLCLVLPQPVISLDPPPALCTGSEACYRELLEAMDASSSLAQRTPLLDFLRSNYPDSPWTMRAVLRHGLGLTESFPGEALNALQQVTGEFPELTDYLNFWVGEAYERLENWEAAAQAFLKVSRMDFQSLLRGEGLYRAGLMLVKLKDCPQALATFSTALSAFPDSPQAPSALWAMGHCEIEQGRLEEGQQLLREVWWRYPQSPESRAAEEWLNRELGGEGFVPSLAERYQRAMGLSGAGALEEAVAELGRFLSEASPGLQLSQAQYQLAVALARLKRYPEAGAMFNSLAHSDSSRTDEAWVWLGRVYLRQGKGEQLGQLIRELPASVLAGDQQALIFIFHGIWLEDHDRWAEATEAYDRAARVAHTRSQRLDALWRAGWIWYQREQFADAAKVFEKIATGVPRPDSDSLLQTYTQAVYWWARSEQHLQKDQHARERFQDLANAFPYTYYGQLASDRLSEAHRSTPRLPDLANDSAIAPEVATSLLEDPHYEKVQVLYDLGLFKEAGVEMQEVFRRHGSQPQAFQALLSLAVRVRAYDLGIRLAIRHFGASLPTGELPRTSDAWLGAFPTGYQDLIVAVAPQDVDPYLVAGLIREESLYNPRARSGVGALGLMQLMPATAKRVAHQVGLAAWKADPEALLHPERNIRLGSSYLGELIHDFQGNLVYAVASYNAGPSSVKRWIAKHGRRPPDEFVELIGYRETRGYVKRVLGSYWIYRTVFSAGCSRVSLDTFC